MPNLPEFSGTIGSVARQLVILPDNIGVGRLQVDAQISGKFAAPSSLDLVIADSADYKFTNAQLCWGYNRIVVTPIEGNPCDAGAIITYKLQWSFNGLQWIDDWVPYNNVGIVGGEFPLTNAPPTINFNTTGVASTVYQNAAMINDVKGVYMRIMGKSNTNPGSYTINFAVQLM